MADQVFTLNVLDDKNYTRAVMAALAPVGKRARC